MNDALVLLAFQRPAIDWHGIAPELVLLAAGALITLVDIIFLEKARPFTAALAGLGLLATAVPLLTLAVDGTDRVMFFEARYTAISRVAASSSGHRSLRSVNELGHLRLAGIPLSDV